MRRALTKPVLTALSILTATAVVTTAPAARADETTGSSDTPAPGSGATNASGHAKGLLSISSGPFGEEGQLAFSMIGENEFPFRYAKSGGGDWHLSLRPSADYFIQEHVSVGGILAIETGGGTSTIGIGLRAGYDVMLASWVSLWVRGGLSYAHVGYNAAPSISITTLDLSFPFLFHVVPHFFLGLGPFFSLPLTNSQAMANKDPSYGLTAIVGGYL